MIDSVVFIVFLSGITQLRQSECHVKQFFVFMWLIEQFSYIWPLKPTPILTQREGCRLRVQNVVLGLVSRDPRYPQVFIIRRWWEVHSTFQDWLVKCQPLIYNYVTNCEQKLKVLEVCFCLSTGKVCLLGSV